MTRTITCILSILLLALLTAGCDWYGDDEVVIRPLPYPYVAGIGADSAGEPASLADRGVTFVFEGERVRTVGQDAACSLVDRGRQLWEALAFLYSEREWRAGSFFGNRLFEPRTSEDGVTTYSYKKYQGSLSSIPPRMPTEVVTQVVDAVIYEIGAKGGVMVAAGLSAEAGGPSRVVVDHLRLEHRRGRVYSVGRDRLLAYSFIRRYLDWKAVTTNDGLTIYVRAVDDGVAEPWVPTRDELSGITFYSPDPGKTRVFLAGEELRDLAVNPPDGTRRGSVTVQPALSL